jgi:hypothetical protein
MDDGYEERGLAHTGWNFKIAFAVFMLYPIQICIKCFVLRAWEKLPARAAVELVATGLKGFQLLDKGIGNLLAKQGRKGHRQASCGS